ncbi:spore coat protein CotH [Secundilactobacillus kimchicus]|nr:CotH kinase family protein [Secundilactobacillus kimchicus]MBT9671458.1 spore coat protein CotH [Secundilactobacillus kimchicus]
MSQTKQTAKYAVLLCTATLSMLTINAYGTHAHAASTDSTVQATQPVTSNQAASTSSATGSSSETASSEAASTPASVASTATSTAAVTVASSGSVAESVAASSAAPSSTAISEVASSSSASETTDSGSTQSVAPSAASSAATATNSGSTTFYPNENTASSANDSRSKIINGNISNLKAGKSNLVWDLTGGLFGTLDDMFGNSGTTHNWLQDAARGTTAITDQWSQQNLPAKHLFTAFWRLAQAVAYPLGKFLPLNFAGNTPKPFKPESELSTAIPTMQLDGNLFMATKSNPSTMTFTYYDPVAKVTKTGYAKVNWSGSSTQILPKKNYKIKLYEDAELTKKLNLKLFADFKKENVYQLKANATDVTMSRNLVNAGLWSQIVQSEDNVPVALKSAPNTGSVEGYPLFVYTNGKLQGLYTLNVDKDEKLWGMDKDNPDDIAIMGNTNNAKALMFEANEAKLDDTDFSVESGPISDTGRANFNKLLTFVNTSSDAEFKAHIGDYMDVQSAVDYYLFDNLIGGMDNIAKNATYLSYDGGKTWRMQMYDMDLTWGMGLFGLYLTKPDADYFSASRTTKFPSHNKLLQRIATLFPDEVASRYATLRQKGLIDATNIKDAFHDFMIKPTEQAYVVDQLANPSEMNQWFTSYKQIADTVDVRVKLLDDHFGYQPTTVTASHSNATETV